MKRFITTLALAVAFGLGLAPALADTNIPNPGIYVTAAATQGKVAGQNVQDYQPALEVNTGNFFLYGKVAFFGKFGYDFTNVNGPSYLGPAYASHTSIPFGYAGAALQVNPNLQVYAKYGTFNPTYGSLLNQNVPGVGATVGLNYKLL
jgi:hypothetical protein